MRAAATGSVHVRGHLRQANVHKGRNRDTAWFPSSMANGRTIKTAFERWLAPETSTLKAISECACRCSPPHPCPLIHRTIKLRPQGIFVDTMTSRPALRILQGGQSRLVISGNLLHKVTVPVDLRVGGGERCAAWTAGADRSARNPASVVVERRAEAPGTTPHRADRRVARGAKLDCFGLLPS